MVKEIATYLRMARVLRRLSNALGAAKPWLLVTPQTSVGGVEAVGTRTNAIQRGPDLAAQTAGNAHGPWRVANSPALNIALSNGYFDSLGLLPMVVRF
jgi:hypothetical protein